MDQEKLNILLVDDQPAKLLTYEAILSDLGENLIKAQSAKDALEQLLKQDISVLLIDVCMPDLDGFELATMIREHPRFQKTAIIFISAVLLSDVDHLRGYELGAVDYVPVPVVPEVLRAKVRVFLELYRKTRELERFNRELEQRVAERTLELELSTARLLASEQRRSLALAAGQMGSWEWEVASDSIMWDEGQYRIFGVDPGSFSPKIASLLSLIHPDDKETLAGTLTDLCKAPKTAQSIFRVIRPTGELRWCYGTAVSTAPAGKPVERVSGVTLDFTDRKEAEEQLQLLAREVDHRARNALAVTQSIVRLTRATKLEDYRASVQGRISALARTHTLLSAARWRSADLHQLVIEEFSPYSSEGQQRVAWTGPPVSLNPATAQSIALVIHELATNAAKYGALSGREGRIELKWELKERQLHLDWIERGGPACSPPTIQGFGSKIIGSTIQNQLHGELDFRWQPEGLHVSLSFPLEERRRAAKTRNQRPEDTEPDQQPEKDGGTVLLVEDEAMVALMMKELLVEIGFAVIGPFANVDDAITALNGNTVDAAVLDINLNGQFVYPVTEVLNARRIPFVFVTGYAPETLDQRFSDVPLLQKPIDRERLRMAIARAITGRSNRKLAAVNLR
jgi:two-component sensor histidine kinase/CheY-like chemotaxis protein